MLTLIDDRLAKLEAQQGLTYKGSMHGILERMDRLVYGSDEVRKCIGCDRQTNTVVCFSCCAEIICGTSESLLTAFETNEVPEELEDYQYIVMLNISDPTDIFLGDVQASLLPYLFSSVYDSSSDSFKYDFTEASEQVSQLYPVKDDRFRDHVLRFTKLVIEKIRRKELNAFWKSMMVYGCLLQHLKLRAFDDTRPQEGKIHKCLKYFVDEYAKNEGSFLYRTRLDAQQVLEIENRGHQIRSKTKRIKDTFDASDLCLSITLRTINANGGVLQCPRCKTSPIHREYCGDMGGHHGYTESDNRCPNPKCRYFGYSSTIDWDKWDGFVRIDTESLFPILSCTSLENCQYDMTKAPGQIPPNPPCFPFDEGENDKCVDNFGDGPVRKENIVRALLGKKRKGEEFYYEITLNNIDSSGNHLTVRFNYVGFLNQAKLAFFGRPTTSGRNRSTFFDNHIITILRNRSVQDSGIIIINSKSGIESALMGVGDDWESGTAHGYRFEEVLDIIPQSSFCKCVETSPDTFLLYKSIQSIATRVYPRSIPRTFSILQFEFEIVDVHENIISILGNLTYPEEQDADRVIWMMFAGSLIKMPIRFFSGLHDQECAISTRYASINQYFRRNEDAIEELQTIVNAIEFETA